jgi:hypothetical protein
MRGLLETENVESPVCLSKLAHDLGIDGPEVCLSQVFGRLESTLPRLDVWLTESPSIANAIIWEDAAGAHPWATWPAERQAELIDAFEHAWLRTPIPVPDVPANLVQQADKNQQVTTVISTDDAWAYYKASVAHSLVLEMAGGWPPGAVRLPWWTVHVFSADQLAQLFDSREMFHWNTDPAGYQIVLTYHGNLVPGPPSYAFDFMVRNNMIATTRLEVIGRLLEWCRGNLAHFPGDTTVKNTEYIWQYPGLTPLVRMIQGTVNTDPNGWPPRIFNHWTAGCWGTTGFLRALLRTVNIPVKLVVPSTHAHPWFMTEERYLSHGDDPYDLYYRESGANGQDLLIEQATWDAWFGAALTDAQRLNNVGRQPSELLIKYLPNFLLRAHCDDLANGATEGSDWDSMWQMYFGRFYTRAELHAMGLWARMDAKIAAMGGCANVPNS